MASFLQDTFRRHSSKSMSLFTPFLLGLGTGIALVLLAHLQCGWWTGGAGLWACRDSHDEVLLQVAPAPQFFLPPQDQPKEDVNLKHPLREVPPRLAPIRAARDSQSVFDVVPVVDGCPDRPLQLAVLILSAPSSARRRSAIRGTWTHNYRRRIVQATTKFLIGTLNLNQDVLEALKKEQHTFDDILLLEDLQDSYSNLSTKVLLGLQWANEHVKYDYLVKVDDDSYVQIEGLSNALRKLNCDRRLYWGYFMGHAFPETTGKWAEQKWFHCPHYLPYAMGGGYVLAQRTVSLLMKFSHRLILYNNEDVTVASWLAPYRLNRKHDIRFDVESLSHGCNNGYLISHKERVKSFYIKYTSLMRNGTLCSEEKEIRPAYLYNWTTSPLDCCDRVKGLPVM